MNLIPGKKVYVFYNPIISPSYIEWLTIQKREAHLLFFEGKDPYYAVEYNERSFYAYSNNIAGNVVITEKLWHLPFARMMERCFHFVNLFRKKETAQSFEKSIKKDSLSIF